MLCPGRISARAFISRRLDRRLIDTFRHFTTVSSAMSNLPQRRLARLLSELAPSGNTIGTLRLGDITYDVLESLTPSRLPSNSGWRWSGQGADAENEKNTRGSYLLDVRDPVNLDNLHFMLQKYLLGQDIFLVSHPGEFGSCFAWYFFSVLQVPMRGGSLLLLLGAFLSRITLHSN